MTYYHWLGKAAESISTTPEVEPRPQADAETIEFPGCVMVQDNE
jgi:hypothetical protein